MSLSERLGIDPERVNRTQEEDGNLTDQTEGVVKSTSKENINDKVVAGKTDTDNDRDEYKEMNVSDDLLNVEHLVRDAAGQETDHEPLKDNDEIEDINKFGIGNIDAIDNIDIDTIGNIQISGQNLIGDQQEFSAIEVIKTVQQNRKKRQFSTIDDEEMSRLEFQQWTSGFLADDLDGSNVDVEVAMDDVEYGFPQTTAEHFRGAVDDSQGSGVNNGANMVGSNASKKKRTEKKEVAPKEQRESLLSPARQNAKGGVDGLESGPTMASDGASKTENHINLGNGDVNSIAEDSGRGITNDNNGTHGDIAEKEDDNVDPELANIDTNAFVNDVVLNAYLHQGVGHGEQNNEEDGTVESDSRVLNAESEENLAVEAVSLAVNQAVAAVHDIGKMAKRFEDIIEAPNQHRAQGGEEAQRHGASGGQVGMEKKNVTAAKATSGDSRNVEAANGQRATYAGGKPRLDDNGSDSNSEAESSVTNTGMKFGSDNEAREGHPDADTDVIAAAVVAAENAVRRRLQFEGLNEEPEKEKQMFELFHGNMKIGSGDDNEGGFRKQEEAGNAGDGGDGGPGESGEGRYVDVTFTSSGAEKGVGRPSVTEHGIKGNSVKAKVGKGGKPESKGGKRHKPKSSRKSGEPKDSEEEPVDQELIASAVAKAQKVVADKSTGRSFSKEEIEAIDVFIKEYQKIHGMTHEMFLQRIWSNERKKDRFWEILQHVLPGRTRSSLYKHVRRTYHIFEKRGVWTPEEDQRLAELAKTCNAKWKAIGEEMKRMPEDCRDRWRNYVKCGAVRNVNKWTLEEEERLKQVISDILQQERAKLEQGADGGAPGRRPKQMREAQVSPTINWTTVSEIMGGTRSRIQCRYKWKKVMRMESLQKLRDMDQETKLWMLQSIRSLGEGDPNIEANLDWNALALSIPKSVAASRLWNGVDLSTCFQRMKASVEWRGSSFLEIVDLLIDTMSASSYVAHLGE